MKKGLWLCVAVGLLAMLGLWSLNRRLRAAPSPADVTSAEAAPLLNAAVDPIPVENSQPRNRVRPVRLPLVTAEPAARSQRVAQAQTRPALTSPRPVAEPDFGSLPEPFLDAPYPPVRIATPAPIPVDESPADALSVDPDPLRRELMTAVARKLQLMSVDQLRDSLQREYAAIRELEADIQLAKARLALEVLSQSHPETRSGKAAVNLLRTNPTPSQFAPVNATDAATFEPGPVPRFETINPRKSVEPLR